MTCDTKEAICFWSIVAVFLSSWFCVSYLLLDYHGNVGGGMPETLVGMICAGVVTALYMKVLSTVSK